MLKSAHFVQFFSDKYFGRQYDPNHKDKQERKAKQKKVQFCKKQQEKQKQ